jgi:Xaa-Pro aminopeptidase
MLLGEQRRIRRLRRAMERDDVDAAVVSPGPDLRYFTGYEANPSERLTALVVQPTAEPVLLVPTLEARRVGNVDIEVRAWEETEDPVALIAKLVPDPGAVAVADHMWSAFLMRFSDEWRHAEWLPLSELTAPLRMRKDQEEVVALRGAAQAVDQVMKRIPKEVKFAGRTEREVARHIAEMTLEEGHDTAEFTIVAAGPNGASPHHEPGTRVIEKGDLVVCDFGGRRNGYYSDCTRTFSVGRPSPLQAEVHRIVRTANEAGRDSARPGVACEEVDRRARQVVADAGYGPNFIHRTGHGIGLEVHEQPYIVEGNDQPLEPGMAFSVEPGIYMEGMLGVRIEDIVVCTENGAETLNQAPRDLVVVR